MGHIVVDVAAAIAVVVVGVIGDVVGTTDVPDAAVDDGDDVVADDVAEDEVVVDEVVALDGVDVEGVGHVESVAGADVEIEEGGASLDADVDAGGAVHAEAAVLVVRAVLAGPVAVAFDGAVAEDADVDVVVAGRDDNKDVLDVAMVVGVLAVVVVVVMVVVVLVVVVAFGTAFSVVVALVS